MSIEFKCQSCGRSVKAPDNAGGRRGKCPFCNVSVFIPAPPSESDEIGLAPIDSTFAAREAQLRKESIDYAAAVDHDEARPAGADTPKTGPRRAADGDAVLVDIPVEVENFVRAMHGSDLKMADRVVSRLRQRPGAARDYIQGMMVDQLGIRVEGIPTPLIQGFLKNLLTRIS